MFSKVKQKVKQIINKNTGYHILVSIISIVNLMLLITIVHMLFNFYFVTNMFHFKIFDWILFFTIAAVNIFGGIYTIYVTVKAGQLKRG